MEQARSMVVSKRVWESVKMYTVQCAKCSKWRLIPTKEMYEDIREMIAEQPFICETARKWRPNVSCEHESDVNQDSNMCWAMDRPSIPRTPSGWQRIIRVRAEGGTKFADIYYVTPANKRLRSRVELDRYIAEHPHEGISASQFSFQPPIPLSGNYGARRRAHSPSSNENAARLEAYFKH
ncbi:methyl-CpG-binding domain-containing protein 2-like isoform X2 [Andrographis paniculata]|uniref:methyl-CpG-binding domain-containing protein 2-like isoform X2 n=1 Tax=Andrographis paniculata TaxID=175694 RepID=UPI0021E7193D|nr:methyl-CpG-binding domain-containing protein 2-like isoform X2 [Andrographis paniculata]